MSNAVSLEELAQERPYLRMAQVQRLRAMRLLQKLGLVGANWDQYPGKLEPFSYAVKYGPISLITAGRGTTGFRLSATLATPGTPMLPTNGNMLTGQDGVFWWCSTSLTAEFSWSYASDPGFACPIDTRAAGPLYSSVRNANGGGMQLMNFSGALPLQPHLCSELEMLDKRRGRLFTDGKIPAEAYIGLAYGPRKNVKPLRIDVNSEIEPRLYINEFSMGTTLSTDQAYAAARVAANVTLTFKGFKQLAGGGA